MKNDTISYSGPSDGVARIVLNRPEVGNAQSRQLLYELSDAFDRAAMDDDVRVVVLAAEGKHFSSGHDLRDRAPMTDFAPVGCCGGFDLPGAEGGMATEQELYLGLCWRGGNVRQPPMPGGQRQAVLAGRAVAVVSGRCRSGSG